MSRAPHEPGWKFNVILGGASALSPFAMASVVPALPLLRPALQADYAALQFVISAYLLGLGLFQPIQGLLADRFGRRPVLLSGFCIFALASIYAATVDSLPELVFARFLQAIGVSVATVVSRAMVRDTHEPERAATTLAVITAVMGVAPILAPLAGGYAADRFGWRSVFALHGLIGGVLLMWMIVSLGETRPSQTRSMTLRQLIGGFLVLLRDRAFVAHTLNYGFTSGTAFVFITVGAGLFASLFGMSASEFGVFWAMLAVTFTLGAMLAARFARRFGTERVLMAGMRLLQLSGALFFLAALQEPASIAWFALSLAGLTCANGLTAPLALASAVSRRAELAGVAAGLSSSIGMLTAMLCAVAAGMIYDGRALSCAMLLAICCVLAYVMAHLARPAEARQ